MPGLGCNHQLYVQDTLHFTHRGPSTAAAPTSYKYRSVSLTAAFLILRLCLAYVIGTWKTSVDWIKEFGDRTKREIRELWAWRISIYIDLIGFLKCWHQPKWKSPSLKWRLTLGGGEMMLLAHWWGSGFFRRRLLWLLLNYRHRPPHFVYTHGRTHGDA